MTKAREAVQKAIAEYETREKESRGLLLKDLETALDMEEKYFINMSNANMFTEMGDRSKRYQNEILGIMEELQDPEPTDDPFFTLRELLKREE